jgi:hypothetical protein
MNNLLRVVAIGFVLMSIVLIVSLIAVVLNHVAPVREIQIVHQGQYRKLMQSERKIQWDRSMLYRVEENIQVSFLYNGKRELVTIPCGSVFDGDSLKRKFGLNSCGIAWVVHDWLYRHPHQLDSGVELFDRKHADEIMYELLSHEGVGSMVYASVLRMFDSVVATTLDRAWYTDNSHKDVSVLQAQAQSD